MSIRFKEKPTAGEEWSLEVRMAAFLLGHIRKSGDGYAYYNGGDNTSDASLWNKDLNALKDEVLKKFSVE